MYHIQMRENGKWWTLGGTYSQGLADIRIAQFMTCFTSRGTCNREFRLIEAAQ